MKYTQENPLKVVELFAGYGSQALALERLGIPFTSVMCEIDKNAIKAYDAIHGDTENLGNIMEVERLPECDLVTWSFPCLTGDSLVLTDGGWAEIKDVKEGDRVLTDDGFRTVTASAQTGVKPTMTIKASCGVSVNATDYHPFWARVMSRRWNNDRRSYDRVFSDPEFVPAKDLTTSHYVGYPIPCEQPLESFEDLPVDSEDFWWTVGRYLADGCMLHDGYGVALCIGKKKKADIGRIHKDLKLSVYEERTIYRATVLSKPFARFCAQFGTHSYDKYIPEKYLGLPKPLAKALLDGYMSGDGSYTKPTDTYRCWSVSRALVLSISRLVAYVYGRPSSIFENDTAPTAVIEGRVVNQRPSYEVRFHKDRRIQDKAFVEDGWVWAPIIKISEPSEPVPVYDITVDDRHRFIANGIMVKNCTDLSVAGLQMGMSEESGTRSALCWEVVRLLRVAKEDGHMPEMLVMENVPAILNKKNLPQFQKLCTRLEELGYTNSYAVLNAKDYGIPQNRKRCFMVSMLNGREFVFPEGFELTKRLKDVLEDEVDEWYYLSEERIAKYESHRLRQQSNGHGFGWVPKCFDEVSNTIVTAPNKDATNTVIEVVGDLHMESTLEQHNRVHSPDGICPTITTVLEQPIILEAGNLNNDTTFRRANTVFSIEGVAPTITSEHLGINQPKIETIEYPTNTLAGYVLASEGDGLVMERPTKARGTVQVQSSPTLTTGRGCGSGVVVSEDPSEELPEMEEGDVCAMLTPGREEKRQNGRRFKEPDEPAFTVSCQDKNGIAGVSEGRLRIRYLTERECMRLMDVPEDAIDRVFDAIPSRGARYKLAGNSIVVAVLENIFKGMLIDETFKDSNKGKQATLGEW